MILWQAEYVGMMDFWLKYDFTASYKFIYVQYVSWQEKWVWVEYQKNPDSKILTISVIWTTNWS